MANLKYQLISNTQKGAVLLEALIAILIFSFGILAISGLQGAMVRNTTQSNYRAEASYIVQQYVGRMWANSDDITTYLGTTVVTDRLPQGTLEITQVMPVTSNIYNFVVKWKTPGEPVHSFTANATIDPN
jgi:type IV pilus assembly protein PilV